MNILSLATFYVNFNGENIGCLEPNCTSSEAKEYEREK